MAVGLDRGMDDDADRRLLLQRQLRIMWRFAEEFVLGKIDQQLALWEPSTNVCTIHPKDGRWVADWPDEDRTPLPEATIAWLLWHIEWWWADTILRVNGRTPLAPEEHSWSGGTRRSAALKQQWDTVLAEVWGSRRTVARQGECLPEGKGHQWQSIGSSPLSTVRKR